MKVAVDLQSVMQTARLWNFDLGWRLYNLHYLLVFPKLTAISKIREDVHKLSLSSRTNDRYFHSPELRVKVPLQEKCRRNMQKKYHALETSWKLYLIKEVFCLMMLIMMTLKSYCKQRPARLWKIITKICMNICFGSNSSRQHNALCIQSNNYCQLI